MLIDLRSDTVTRPTAEMLRAMAEAELGDDGLEGDPTVRRLEAMAANLLGKEEGLFVVSGTMANTLAMMALAAGVGTVLAHESAHMLVAEMGSLTTVGGLFYKPLPGDKGAMQIEALRAAYQPKLKDGQLPTALIALENTHNRSGGRVLPLDYLAAVRRLADELDVPVHIDGARVFNAAIALGVQAREIASYANTVSFCLSKGLSAPVGSMIVGSAQTIARARALRKMLGGTLRQAGVIAAAGIVALETMIERLAEDQARAKALAVGIHSIDPSLINPDDVETNMLRIDLSTSKRNAEWWSKVFKAEGLWTLPNPSYVMRLVTNRHIGDKEVEQSLAIIKKAWNQNVRKR